MFNLGRFLRVISYRGCGGGLGIWNIFQHFPTFRGERTEMLRKIRPMQSNRKIVRIMMEPADLFFFLSPSPSFSVSLRLKAMEMKTGIL